jgi:hypothetical protein
MPKDLDPVLIARVTGAKVHNVDAVWHFVCKELRAFCSGDQYWNQVVVAATIATENGSWVPVREYGDRAYFQRYEGRADLGNKFDGDGYRYRGAGLIQLTGRANAEKYSRLTGIDIVGNPDLLLIPELSARVLASYAKECGLDVWANRWGKNGCPEDYLRKCRKIVNGGYNGWYRFKSCALGLRDATSPKVPSLIDEELVRRELFGGDHDRTDSGIEGSGTEGGSSDSPMPGLSDMSGVREGGGQTPPDKSPPSGRRKRKGTKGATDLPVLPVHGEQVPPDPETDS